MLIGIDVGTTAVKAALFDQSGHCLRQFSRTYPTQRPFSGHVEQDPNDWMELVLAALHELSQGNTITAIGLCSQVNTHVFVDAHGIALSPAITWQDTRCAFDASEIDARLDINQKITWWGAPLPVDASHVLARMAYIARTDPALWTKTRFVFAPKDYCLYHLTGEAVADPMTNFGILDQDLQLIDPLLDQVAGARERMPSIHGFTHWAGKIRNGLPCAGVPIVIGAMDAWSGLLGAGVTENGQGLYLSGTSEILGLISDDRHPTPGVIAFAKCEGITLHAGPTQSGGASVHWASRLLGLDMDEFFAKAAQADLDYVPLFLPHLEGERAPLWDSQAKGSFTGMRFATGAPELARSVLEGVAYSARLVFDSLERSAKRKADVIHLSGGGSRSDLWAKIRSDVLNVSLKRTSTHDAGVLGAALMAGVGCEMFSSLSNAARNFVLYDKTFEPDKAAQARHHERFETYKMTYEQLRPVNHASPT